MIPVYEIAVETVGENIIGVSWGGVGVQLGPEGGKGQHGLEVLIGEGYEPWGGDDQFDVIFVHGTQTFPLQPISVTNVGYFPT